MTLETFADFRSIIRDEARQAYLDLLDRRSGEHVCAFALVTDADRFGANAAGDTIERRQQRLAKRPPRNRAEEKYHVWSYAWNTGEWDAIYSADRPCAHPSALSGEQEFKSMLAFEQAWSSSGGSERAFKRNMLRSTESGRDRGLRNRMKFLSGGIDQRKIGTQPSLELGIAEHSESVALDPH